MATLPPTSDPYTTLDINPYDWVTCIGHATTKRRECHSRVSKTCRDKACHILDQLSTGDQDVNVLVPYLRSLAKFFLCRHRRRVGSGLLKGGLNPPVAGNGLGIPPFNPPENPAGLIPGTQ